MSESRIWITFGQFFASTSRYASARRAALSRGKGSAAIVGRAPAQPPSTRQTPIVARAFAKDIAATIRKSLRSTYGRSVTDSWRRQQVQLRQPPLAAPF